MIAYKPELALLVMDWAMVRGLVRMFAAMIIHSHNMAKMYVIEFYANEIVHKKTLRQRTRHSYGGWHEESTVVRKISDRNNCMRLHCQWDQKDIRGEEDGRLQQATQSPVWGKRHTCLEIIRERSWQRVTFWSVGFTISREHHAPCHKQVFWLQRCTGL